MKEKAIEFLKSIIKLFIIGTVLTIWAIKKFW